MPYDVLIKRGTVVDGSGAGRYVQTGRGYGYVLVNGQVFMESGEHSGALSGQMLRS